MAIYDSPEALMEGYVAALLAGDAAAVEAMYEEEAVYYRPTRDVLARGREAIAAFYRGAVEAQEFTAVRRLEGTITTRDDYAFQHGLDEIVGTARDSGEEVRMESRSTLIFHRGDDGGWRFQTMQGN